MKQSLLLLCFFLSATLLFAGEFEKNYGNGVIHINPDSAVQIEFYAAPNGEVTHRLYITHNAWTINRTMTTFDRFIDSVPAWFKTEYFIVNGEYARIDIKAVDSSNGYYRTLLRDSADREVWIKKQKHVSFLTWFGFYQTVSSIELLRGEVILYDKPDANSQQKNYSKMYPNVQRTTMRPLEVKGNWMKVEIQYAEDDLLSQWHFYTGWIQWRNEKRPLVKYNLMGC